MRSWLLRLLGSSDPSADDQRAARLTQSEALSIARQAGDRVSAAHDLDFVAIEREGGELLWVFSTNWRGSAWQVKVRDRDGKVVSRGLIGVR